MEESYERFIKAMVDAVQGAYPEGYRVEAVEMPQVNGKASVGLCVKGAKAGGSPVVRLDKYFAASEEGTPLGELASEVVGILRENGGMGGEVAGLFDPETVRDRVIFRLISFGKNIAFLRDVPYVPFCDLAVVFYVLVKHDTDGEMAALVHKRHMESWEMTVGELMELAKRNTPRLLAPSVRSMGEVLRGLAPWHGGEFLDSTPGGGMYVLTTREGVYGASAILYPGLLERLSHEVGGDLVLLPSSRHEVLAIPYEEEMDLDDIRGIVRKINDTVLEEKDFLSNQIYFYREDWDAAHVI